MLIIGQRLCSDTNTQQTNTGQTPDARLHAFPHCGLGPVRKTGKAQTGSATGYQSRNLFIEGRREIAGKRKGRPVGLPLRTSSVLDAYDAGSPHAVFWT
ncbi:hypothetical protein COJ85_28800, partial [Bacillus sp. AFS076308]